jgi:hypothetical protein
MIARILSALVGLVFVVLTFIFASLLVAIAVAAGLLLWAWAWWRGHLKVTRWVRTEVKGGVRHSRGEVIEGEYRIIEK